MKYIIVSHGHLAIGLKDTLEFIVGKQENVIAYAAYCDGNDSVKEFVAEDLARANGEAVIFTDVFGGSVNNDMIALLAEYPQLVIVTGVNLPMLLTVVMSPNLPIVQAIQEAREGIMQITVDSLTHVNEGGGDLDD